MFRCSMNIWMWLSLDFCSKVKVKKVKPIKAYVQINIYVDFYYAFE